MILSDSFKVVLLSHEKKLLTIVSKQEVFILELSLIKIFFA